MIIYGLKNCDTCRKAAKAYPQAEFIDVRQTVLPEPVLVAAMEKFGDALVNKRSTTWRQIPEPEKSDAPKDLLRRYPSLMKRPLISVNDQFFLSWNKDIQAAVDSLL